MKSDTNLKGFWLILHRKNNVNPKDYVLFRSKYCSFTGNAVGGVSVQWGGFCVITGGHFVFENFLLPAAKRFRA